MAHSSLKIPLSEFENSLKLAFSGLELPKDLSDALAYVLFPGGKRIRPRLGMAICQDLGGDSASIIPGLVSIELLHAASLIHDDLPALDNDDMRRGKPSCHRMFSESTAILTADFMISLAFKVVLGGSMPEGTRAEMGRRLSQAFMDLCVGQILDLKAGSSKEELVRIHEMKTGALFSATTAFGAIGAGESEGVVRTSSSFGRKFGFAFQLIDDYLDLFGSQEQTGRLESSDIRNDKVTFFNHRDQETGLSLISETQNSLFDDLKALGQESRQKPSSLPLTTEILDEIFGRVAGAISN